MAGKPNTRFKLFENKTSLAKKFSRILNGGTSELKGNKIGWWERKSIEKDVNTDVSMVLDNSVEGRPDLVAYVMYRNTSLTWLVLQYNNIVDIEEEFIAGREIFLPSRNRVYSEIINNSPIIES